MSDINQNPVEPVAENFVETELQKARASVRRSRTFAAVSVVFVIAYMSFLTITLTTRLLEPAAAAAVTTHYVGTFVQENGTAFSQQLIAEVPQYIAQAPDYALAQLPTMRANLETQLEQVLTQYSQQLTPQLAEVVDQFLVNNQAAIHEFLEKGSDPEAVSELGAHFEEQVFAHLDRKGPEGVSAADRLADGVQALKLAQERLHRLATAADLTTEEKQTRRILGLILQQAHKPQQT